LIFLELTRRCFFFLLGQLVRSFTCTRKGSMGRHDQTVLILRSPWIWLLQSRKLKRMWSFCTTGNQLDTSLFTKAETQAFFFWRFCFILQVKRANLRELHFMIKSRIGLKYRCLRVRLITHGL
jgi:hypothetical protein